MYDKILIKDCRLFNNPEIKIDVLTVSGKILQIKKDISSADAYILNADGRILCPGFIDIHIQGAGGADILDGTPEALEKMSLTLANLGTTSFLGTTVVKPTENNKHLRTANNYVNKNLEGAALLGFHLEGPFINVNKKGGLDPKSIYPSSPEALAEIVKICKGNLRMMTIAPELPGNLELIKQLRQNNVVAAFAHSEADYNQTKAGFDAGIDHITHLFNAMNPINHRNPGPVTAIFENNHVTAQIISDGHHLHPAVIKMIHRNIGAARCVCITDGVQGMGLPEGKYFYNGKEYTAKEGAARYTDGTLIGSTMSLGEIAVKFMEFTECTLTEAIDSVSYNPAKVLGMERQKGKIEPGYDADLVLLNDDLKVEQTIVNGNIYSRN
jgi:N-acetylglucosamine-6-phosphate deacetylase